MALRSWLSMIAEACPGLQERAHEARMPRRFCPRHDSGMRVRERDREREGEEETPTDYSETLIC